VRPVALAAWTALSSGCATAPSAVPAPAQPTTVTVPEEPSEAVGTEPEPPSGDEVTRSDPSCCKGLNECKGKGGCEVAGRSSCRGQNECKGMGGCRSRECREGGKDCCKGLNECKGLGG
jgi:hypothetical protein